MCKGHFTPDQRYLMAICGILFDKDGTLIDFQSTWVPLYKEASLFVAGNCHERAHLMLAASGYDKTTDTILADTVLAQGNNDEITTAWLPHAPQNAGSDTEISSAIGDIFNASIATHAVEVTNLEKLFARLKNKGLKLGVATSDGIDSARSSLNPFGILEQLDFIAGFDSGFGAKPGPGMVEGFAAATGLEFCEIMVVGDSPHDMEMGKAAGAGKNIGVLSGTCAREHLCDNADHVIDNVSNLETVLGI